MEKLEPSNTFGGIVNGSVTMENNMQFPLKIKNRTTR